MYVSSFINLIVVIAAIQYGLFKLMEWFYTGPYAPLAYKVISGAIYLGVFAFLVWNHAVVDTRGDEAGPG